ncbi:MAG TPA: hypothetical protein VFO67_05415 [Gemmatimonadales bacterium]|nr:hypothetical protein [Gemmatimonadales bacterium]
MRAGLDTLYGGDFERAAAHFADLAARDTSDPAPVVFQAGAYIWWAAALDSATFELERIDSLLSVALRRASPGGGGGGRGGGGGADFWRATALGYRARQREENGHSFSAAKDAKAMRDIYRRLLAADSSCADCYLGLGVYDYGLARAGTLARFFARLIGLGSGDAERGIRYMRRVAHDGDLARVEGTWVLAAALMREAARDSKGSAVLQDEARGYVEGLAARYPGNPVFQRFLQELPEKTSARKTIRPAAGAAPAAVPLAPVGRSQRGEFAEHVVDVTLHRVGRDVEPLGDLLVSESRGDELLDLLLPLGEPHDALRGPAAAPAPAPAAALACSPRQSGGRGQVGSARDRTNGFDDVLGGRILHDETVRPTVDELAHVLLRGYEVDQHSLRFGRRRFEAPQQIVAVAVGKGCIEQHDLRLRALQQRRGGVRVLGARDDIDVGIRAEQTREPVAHQTIVFDNQHADARRRAHRRGRNTALRATAVQRSFTICCPIVYSAPTLGRNPALDTANGPRHTPPPFLDVMYFLTRSSGIPREDEA